MRYRITSCAIDTTQAQTGHTLTTAHVRVEVVNAESNELFADCRTLWDIEDRYTAFWNRLNPEDIHRPGATHDQRAKVVVLKVEVV